MKKTKKTKILISIILIFTIGIAGFITLISVNNISYIMHIEKPSRIIVYYNSESNNQVFDKNSNEYNDIYNLIIKSYEKPIIKALTSNSFNKKFIIQNIEQTSVDFKGIKVNFVYDYPCEVQDKNDSYVFNNSTYWYKNLIFSISNADKFDYNSIAIIPPESSSYYDGPYSYNLQYLAYSNFDETYDYILNIFKVG